MSNISKNNEQNKSNFKVGDYVKANEIFMKEWLEHHMVHNYEPELLKDLESSQRRYVYKIVRIYQNGELELRNVIVSKNGRVKLGAWLIQCFCSDFTKVKLSEQKEDLKKLFIEQEEQLKNIEEH